MTRPRSYGWLYQRPERENQPEGLFGSGLFCRGRFRMNRNRWWQTGWIVFRDWYRWRSVLAVHGFLKGLDALTEATHDFGNLLRSENQECYHQNENQF